MEPLDGRGLKPVSWSKFRIHHYGSKSEEELEQQDAAMAEPRLRTARSACTPRRRAESWTRR